MMSKDKRRVPKLRFPGFTEDWEQRKLNDLVTIRRGLTYKPSDIAENGIRVLRSSNIDEDQFITSNDDVFVNIEAVNIPFAKNGDILITSANGSNRLVGKHTIISDIEDNSAVHGGFMLLAESNNPLFTDALLSSNWYKRFINTYVAGGNGAIGNLSKSDLESQTVMIPSEHEQAKIGQWYDNINQLITLHQRKLDNLKLKKKALLQKLFPKNGERYPELRFPGFTDAWEQRKLGEVVKSYSGGTPTASNKDYYGGDIPFIRSAEINSDTTELYITQKGLDNSSAKIVEKGTILYAMYGATSGEVGISKINGAINQAILAMIPLEYNGKIIAQYLRKNKESIIGKYLQGGQGNLSANIILELPIQLPGLEESNQIENFLESFDNIITLHQRKLEHLQLQKKALLQQMFV